MLRTKYSADDVSTVLSRNSRYRVRATGYSTRSSVFILPGLAMRRIADLHASEAKTNAHAAAIIAEAARSMPDTQRSLGLADEQLAEFTMLCGFDNDVEVRRFC